MTMRNDPLKFVNRHEYIQITGSKLPHWNQNDCVQFVTFRLADSLPQLKLQEYRQMREDWLRQYPLPWDDSVKEEYQNTLGIVIDKWIDAGYGECILKDKHIRDITADVIMNDQRCDIYALVIMPNHVHVLMTPREDNSVHEIVGRWKSVSSHIINKYIGKKGSVWERESFDRLVRNSQDFEEYMSYIIDNPKNLSSDWYTLVVVGQEK